MYIYIYILYIYILKVDHFFYLSMIWNFLTHGLVSVGRLARTYLHQLCADTRCNLEDLPGDMNDRDRWRERERESLGIRAVSTT